MLKVITRSRIAFARASGGLPCPYAGSILLLAGGRQGSGARRAAMTGVTKSPRGPDACDEAVERLVERGVDPEKAVQVKRLLRNIVKDGGHAGSGPTGGAVTNPLPGRKRR